MRKSCVRAKPKSFHTFSTELFYLKVSLLSCLNFLFWYRIDFVWKTVLCLNLPISFIAVISEVTVLIQSIPCCLLHIIRDQFMFLFLFSIFILAFRNCADIFKSGQNRDGVYVIKPDDQSAFDVIWWKVGKVNHVTGKLFIINSTGISW